MRLITNSFTFAAFALFCACTNPDVKLGDGDQSTQGSGGKGGAGGGAGTAGTGGGGEDCTGDLVGKHGVCSEMAALKDEALALCSARGGTLADITFDGACAGGLATFAKLTCCGAHDDPLPEPSPCVSEVVGDPGKCVSNEALKIAASEACTGAGLELTDVSYDNACGDAASNLAKAVCCKGGEPPPPPEKCFNDFLGDPAACTDNAALKDKAWYACDAQGAVLTNIDFDGQCGAAASNYAKFECCYAPPPPPPDQCFGDYLGEANTCVDDVAFKDKAASVCASRGAVLTDFAVDHACGAAQSSFAKFTCCGSAEPPPPDPTPICSEEYVQVEKCADNADLAAQAQAVCDGKKAKVDGIAFDGACGPSSSLLAKFFCCAAEPPPPAPSCWDDTIDAGACTDNAALKEKIAGQCAALGGEVSAIGYDNQCGPDSSQLAKFICCSVK
jgi:hypothetical protein